MAHIKIEDIYVKGVDFLSRAGSLKERLLSKKGSKFKETRIPILNGVDFEAKSGDRIGILGRNGSGKSSLLKVIAGTYPVNSGIVNISGKIVPLIGLGAEFLPTLTGRDNIILSFIWGGVLNGFAHAIFIIATRHLLAAEITLFMLLEFTLGPLWVWYFVGEVPAINTLYGGGIVMSAIAMLTFYELWKRKKLNNIIKEIGWNENTHETTKMTDNNSTNENLTDLGSKLVKQDIKIDLIKENQIKENIKVEIEKLLLPTLNKWFENDLKKMIKKHLDDQINELKKNN